MRIEKYCIGVFTGYYQTPDLLINRTHRTIFAAGNSALSEFDLNEGSKSSRYLAIKQDQLADFSTGGLENFVRKFFVASSAALVLPLSFAKPATAQSVPISSVYSSGPATYTLTGTVTSILNSTTTANTITLTDNSGSIIAFGIAKTNYTATVGDNVTFSGATDVTYQGAPELTNTGLTATSVTVNSTGNPTSPQVLTIPQFNSAGTGSVTMTAVPPFAEAIVSLNNVSLPTNTTTLATATTYTLTDQSGNTTPMYTIASDSSVVAAVSAANTAETASGNTLYAGLVNIVGYADVFKGVPEIYPLSITAASTTPEPTSLGLIGFGVMGLVGRRRRVFNAARCL